MPTLTSFAEQGYLVVTTDYRLAPKFNLKIMIEDCKKAINFAYTKLKVDKYGYKNSENRKRYVILAGDSAGGNLVTTCALTMNDPYFDTYENTNIYGCIDLYGLKDLLDTNDVFKCKNNN